VLCELPQQDDWWVVGLTTSSLSLLVGELSIGTSIQSEIKGSKSIRATTTGKNQINSLGETGSLMYRVSDCSMWFEMRYGKSEEHVLESLDCKTSAGKFERVQREKTGVGLGFRSLEVAIWAKQSSDLS